MNEQIWNIIQILFADIILSGDNALIIGMAASGLSPELRRKAFILGLALAAFFRIFFAIIATYLIEIPGILFFGGLLLYFVCWRFFLELKNNSIEGQKIKTDVQKFSINENKKLLNALLTLTIADISMSIDNVLAVAAIAREDRTLLIFGLVLAFNLFNKKVLARKKNPRFHAILERNFLLLRLFFTINFVRHF